MKYAEELIAPCNPTQRRVDMNDRELLELAARADGRVLKWKLGFHQTTLPPSVPYFEVGGLIQYWNPLKDDGDALRLAVTLNMDLNINDGECDVYAADSFYSGRGDDTLETTRRAIVRAAAAIGAAL